MKVWVDGGFFDKNNNKKQEEQTHKIQRVYDLLIETEKYG